MTPPIYFINLAARTDRLAFMQAQFDALDLHAERVPAVEATALPGDLLARYGNLQHRGHQAPGPLACALSHIAAWRLLLDSGANWGLVLEDDALLSSDLPAFLADFSPSGFDLVRIEAVHRRARLLPPERNVGQGRAIRRFRSALIGSAGYIVTAAAAEKLLARQAEVLSLPIDFALTSQMHEPARSLQVALVEPALCVQLMYAGGVGSAARGDIQHATAGASGPSGQRPSFADRLQGSIANLVDNLLWYPRGARRGRVPFDGRPVETMGTER